MRRQPMIVRPLVAAALVLGLAPVRTHAFCGFYVSGADQSLYSSATMVVLMRDGQRTVLSMQNNYQGPPQDFAMVVPVPTVLSEENVKTLPREIFTRVDSLAAPRLVEYWESDPCSPDYGERLSARRSRSGGRGPVAAPSAAPDLGVTVEAEFAVGEYDIAILSASDSSGLETWLHRERYNIPEGAGEVLRPYVEAGTKFFVARVDIERVTFVGGRAVLSPLRVHYDTPELSLPVRLGLLNSSGEQDLLVHVLARGQRYEVANYANVTIPTNIRVVDGVRDEFGAFYEYLFRETIERNPRAVVTEYAWDASGCDPCPTPALTPSELMTLGGDVLPGAEPGAPVTIGRSRRMPASGFVLTRLHYRYSRDDLGEDLVFRAAAPLIGGGGVPAPDGTMPATQAGGINRFQGRYVILHPWEGALACASPQRGRWGGPSGASAPQARSAPSTALTSGIPAAASDGTRYLAQPVPELDARPPAAEPNAPPPPAAPEAPTPPAAQAPQTQAGCAGCSAGGASDRAALLVLLAVTFGVVARTKRRR